MHYLRDLLVDCGVLPAADRQLREFGTWLDRRLDALARHPHLRLLRQFGLWHQLPAMRARAAAGPLRTTAAQYARSRFIAAQAFLTWTAGLGVRPAALTQAHIDDWYVSHGTHQREGVRAFLVWAAGHGHIPRHLDIPRPQPCSGQAITQQCRLDLLRRFATSTGIPVKTRAAACLMLLYARPRPRQPRQRLAVSRPPRRPARRLPGHRRPTPRPRPAAAHRPHLRAAPARPGRPRPRRRRRLGFHHTTTTRQHASAGATWSQYAAGQRPGHDPREDHDDWRRRGHSRQRPDPRRRHQPSQHAAPATGNERRKRPPCPA
ncbi:MAG TPA: hypothetical protein VFQ68_21130 [Streptosporangiaceae bacterium]|nr:hypothetical protein [Streptosporangiaceae bacterium]